MEAALITAADDVIPQLIEVEDEHIHEVGDAMPVPLIMAGREFFVPCVKKELLRQAKDRESVDWMGDTSKLVRTQGPFLMKSGQIERWGQTHRLAVHPATFDSIRFQKYRELHKGSEDAFINPTNSQVIQTEEELGKNPPITVYAISSSDGPATILAFPGVAITEVGEF